MTRHPESEPQTESAPARWQAVVPCLYLPLLLLMVVAYSWRPLHSTQDVWSHAAVGRWIWQHGAFPHQTLFLWSAKVDWVAHSWLTQLTYYSLLANGGPWLVIAVKVALVCAVFGLLWRLWARGARVTVLTPFLFSLAVQCSRNRFASPRPEQFSALFFVLLLGALACWPTKNSQEKTGVAKVGFLALPALFCLWANFHGGVAMGLVALAVFVVCDFAQSRGADESRKLAVVAVLCLAAVFINPYGWKYLAALGQVNSNTFAQLDEWKPFWQVPFVPLEFVINIGLLCLLAWMAWILNPQRRWAWAGLLLTMTWFFMQSRRHIWLLAVVCLAVAATNAASLDTEHLWRELKRSRDAVIPELLRGLARLGVVACLLVWTLVALPADLFPLRPVSNPPDALLDFLENNPRPGRLLSDFNISGVLEWRFGEKTLLFLDVLNAYPDHLMAEYADIFTGRTNGLAKLNDWQVGTVIIRSPKRDLNERWPALAVQLEVSPAWKRVHTDDTGAVWQRVRGLNQNPAALPKKTP